MGNQNNREIYADKIYSDILFYKETQECKKLSLFTPVKAIKGESPEITKREKVARDLFSTAVSKVRQLIESLFNIWASSTHDGKNSHHIDYPNF